MYYCIIPENIHTSPTGVPGVQIAEHGRKIYKEKKQGETRGGKLKGMPDSVYIPLQSSFHP